MIRKIVKEDLESINEIGLSIHDDFNKKENIEKFIAYDYAEIYVYEENNIIKAFLQIENHFEITDIINIAVNKKYLKEGIASKLIEFLIETTKAEKIMLEVRSSNTPAINLYRKFGFVDVRIRKNYYGEDDAIVMERRINHVN